ncbi:class I SAM-dependent methyltransferase [Streptomyces yatensis]|uniref:Methyltransferase domain-containing protein n=1 Tax=Streptomyces yatensis TaxID=155177 RepID=A0ABN2IA35_9ACTN|nr:class I SAM-dependent methyltransferase [Streptomyces yatensis]
MTTTPHFTPTPAATPTTDSLFCSSVAVSALSAAVELGLLDDLKDRGEIRFDDRQEGADRIDPAVVRGILLPLEWAGIVELDDRSARPGPGFEAAYLDRGYFYWLAGGNGELTSRAPHVALERNRHGEFYHRDMRAVAVSSRMIGDVEVELRFDKILADQPPRAVCDLGCGSGQRLIRIAGNHPGVRGVGVDIAPAAVELSGASFAEAGMADRISVHHGDVHALPQLPEFAGIDTVTCVFMGHDFWPYDKCVTVLRRIREVFPDVERFLLCDVVRSEVAPGPQTPIFTLGFEFAHALMGVTLPTRSEWMAAFDASGWECEAVQEFNRPPGGLLFELRPGR